MSMLAPIISWLSSPIAKYAGIGVGVLVVIIGLRWDAAITAREEAQAECRAARVVAEAEARARQDAARASVETVTQKEILDAHERAKNLQEEVNAILEELAQRPAGMCDVPLDLRQRLRDLE